MTYKILEKLGWGPDVHFLPNPFMMNDMFIITKDLEEDYPDFVIAFNYREIYEKLSPDQKRDLKIKATAFDLLNRILMLNDINDLNYGIIPRDNSIKLFDFRVILPSGGCSGSGKTSRRPTR